MRSPGSQRFVTSAVVTFALCEVTGIFGLVLFFPGRSTADFSRHLFVPLLFFFVHFPQFSRREEAFRRQRRRQ